MHIIFTIKNINGFAGTERVTSIITNALVKKGHQVGIISFIGEGGTPFYHIDSSIKLFYIAPPKDKHLFPYRDIRRIRKIRKILLLENPDIVVFVDSGHAIVNISAARGFPFITWEQINVSTCKKIKRRISRALVAKYSRAIVSLTDEDAAAYISKFNALLSVCIPNPITIQGNYKSSLKSKRVIAIGRFSKEKGLDMLLRAWSLIKEKDGWILRLVGDGPMKRNLCSLVNELGIDDTVEIKPPTKDVISEYLNSSICVSSSKYEGFGLVLLEAMTLGLPVISFDCSGPKFIIEDGVSGILVTSGDIDEYAAALSSLIKDPINLKRLSVGAIENSKKYGLDYIIPQWESLFSQVVSGQMKRDLL